MILQPVATWALSKLAGSNPRSVYFFIHVILAISKHGDTKDIKVMIFLIIFLFQYLILQIFLLWTKCNVSYHEIIKLEQSFLFHSNPNAGLNFNYCRNPSANYPYAWCYIKVEGPGEPDWEDCDVPKCVSGIYTKSTNVQLKEVSYSSSYRLTDGIQGKWNLHDSKNISTLFITKVMTGPPAFQRNLARFIDCASK